MRVELVRAWPGRFEQVVVDLPPGATVGDALAASGWSLDAEFVALAVFGRRVTEQSTLEEGDRVELLRPLQCDPMQARRRRAGKPSASNRRG